MKLTLRGQALAAVECRAASTGMSLGQVLAEAISLHRTVVKAGGFVVVYPDGHQHKVTLAKPESPA